jgi:sigma-54 specific flagellar transcriptional regulator A
LRRTESSRRTEDLRVIEDVRDRVDVSDSVDGEESIENALKSGGIDLKDHLSAIEIGLIRKALVEADGTVAEAARLLKIRRTTLVEKLRKYRLSA